MKEDSPWRRTSLLLSKSHRPDSAFATEVIPFSKDRVFKVYLFAWPNGVRPLPSSKFRSAY